MPAFLTNPLRSLAAPRKRSTPTPLSLLDWALILVLCILLFAIAAFRSRTRLFWADELISHQIFSDPSFFHRLRAWYRGADSGGLTYYLLFPLWLHVFGLGELSLRLFSTAGMCAALALLWVALRRYVSTPITAAAVGVIFFTPPAMLWQELNGRFYGLYFAFSALAALAFLLVTERERPSPGLLAVSWLAHAGLVASHIFGLLFSFSLIAGLWCADRHRHRTRWPVYLVPAAGWLLVLFSLPSLRASAAVVGKVFWTQKPGFGDLLFSFAGYGRVTAVLLGAALLAALVRISVGRFLLARHKHLPSTPPLPLPLAPTALVCSLAFAALLFFAKSQLGVSIFADRYLLPLLIASAFLLAGALAVLLPPVFGAPRGAVPTLAWSSFALLPCCLLGATRHTNAMLYPTSAYIAEVNSYLRPGVPVVAGLPVFAFLQTYDPAHHLLYLTDWAYDNDPAHLADYSGEHLMENWRRAGYLSPDILSCHVIFTRYPHLDLLIDPHLAPWFHDRILADQHLRVTRTGIIRNWIWVDIWSVDRLTSDPPPC